MSGVAFFGGIGTSGPYLADMRTALENAGASNPRIGRNGLLPGLEDSFLDQMCRIPFLPLLRWGAGGDWVARRNADLEGISDLIGYSYGGVLAAHLALRWPTVERLFLIAAPLSQEQLLQLYERSNLDVCVHNLDDANDPIRPGRPTLALLAAVPRLIVQFINGDGHFLYARPDKAGRENRRQLVEWLIANGMPVNTIPNAVSHPVTTER